MQNKSFSPGNKAGILSDSPVFEVKCRQGLGLTESRHPCRLKDKYLTAQLPSACVADDT